MRSRIARWFVIAAIAAVAALGLSARAPAQTEAASKIPELADQERETCTQNLKVIYAAIQVFQADHNELPNWLSDLVPQYLPDANVLVCPVCRRTGRIESAPLTDPQLASSYLFE